MRYLRKVAKIILVFLLVGVLTVSSAENARAAGAEGVVEIVGGSIAAGGIAAGLAAVAPPALIIIGLVMVAQGIDVALTEASQAEGMTKGEFIQSKFEDFCDYTQKDFERTCNTIVSGAKILTDGTIWLAGEAGNAISQFINNLIANNEIIEVGTSGDTMLVNGLACPVVYSGESLNYGEIETGDVFGFRNNDTVPYVVFSVSGNNPSIYCVKFYPGDFTWTVIINNSLGRSRTVSANRFYYDSTYYDIYYNHINNIPNPSDVYVPIVGTIQEALISLIGNQGIHPGGVTTDSFIGDASIVDTSVLNPSSGNDIVIDTGIDLQGISSRYGDIGVISVDNYLDTLRDAINGVTDLTIAVQNVATGVIDNVDVGVYNPTDVAVSNEAEEEAENQIATPVIDVNEYPSGEAAEQALNDLQFDLTKIFPFCIPFDLVHLVQKFDVTPVAPHVQVSVPLPGVGTDFELDIDLSDFDGVARVARMMELIASIVGLAMVTRGLIRG